MEVLKEITKKQKETLKKHSKHHSSKHMASMKKEKAKIQKVIKGLKKASKLHAGQAKVLTGVIKKKNNIKKA